MGDPVNPWLAVPSEPPYWLQCDYEKIRTYNAKCLDEKYELQERVLPEPFIGRPDAPVTLLNLNPGFDDRDPDDHMRPEFQALLRDNYEHSLSSFPFYSLNPYFKNGGRTWWEKKLKSLLDVCKRDQLAQGILCVEYFPYHSRRFRHAKLKLPSQEYGFYLARLAIARGAVTVIMRGRDLWVKAIPELQGCSRVFTLNSRQNVVVSPRNCAGFELIVSAIGCV